MLVQWSRFRYLLPSLALLTLGTHAPITAATHPVASLASATAKLIQQKEGDQDAEGAEVAKSPAKPKGNPLVEAICKLSFDRRNETLIKQWSEALLPEEPEEEEDASDEDETATPAELVVQAGGRTIHLPPGAVAPAGVIPGQPGADTEKISPEVQERATQFQQWVVLGDWEPVRELIAELNDEKKRDAERVYDHVLNTLPTPPSGHGHNQHQQMMPHRIVRMQMRGQGPVTNTITPADLEGLVLASPWEFTDQRLAKLSGMLQSVKQHGHVIDAFVDRLEAGLGTLGGDTGTRRYHAARLLLNARELQEAERFLPEWQDDEVRADPYAVELLADFYHRTYQMNRKVATLATCWEIHQHLSSMEDVSPKTLQQTLSRLVTMSTQVERDLGQAWLEDSFAGDAERGVRLLTIFGTQTAQNLQRALQNPSTRLSSLRLQQMAGEALVKAMGDDAPKWQPVLTRMAETWIREAELSHQYTRDRASRMEMQWDQYGNMYYIDQHEMMERFGHHNDQPQPIPIADLLEVAPSEAWLACVDSSLRPSFPLWFARLHLKSNHEEEAFPHIVAVADSQPNLARDLVHTFLIVWRRNHDPNSARQQYNPFMRMYGFNGQSEAIPLTRSKQERNLADLKQWVEKIRGLPIEPIDETHLAAAFSNCHSSAEVYKLSAFEEVFGDVGALEPTTVAQLASSMRTNLASVWRRVKTQEEYKTKRNEKEVQAEVLNGYDVALSIVSRALEQHPDDWQLKLVNASLCFDKNEYGQTVAKSSEFSARRRECYRLFQEAAEAYAKKVPELDKIQQTPDVYCTWFYAALGSSELGFVSHEQVPATDEFPKIRAAMGALTPSAADHHLGEFANSLFERMRQAQPQVKFRYIRGGMQIAGDHPRAREARQSLNYYTDIVREVELHAKLDGSDNVGHEEPFGLFVNLVHTSEMERESGGFEKYVQNQNAGSFYYNYGRPPENYRDKFQKAVTQALEEQFEVLSVTFESPKQMRSRPLAGREGWRETPYAYVLLKPRGPEVDILPELKLDLDFLDANGFVVIPINSAAMPLNATGTPVDLRPLDNLQIVQTLDERLADEGTLVLEIKATATGLIPSLDKILDASFDQLEVATLDDQGVSPSEFDSESDAIQVKSDRSWVVELVSKQDAAEVGRDFRFCALTEPDTAELTYQRYDDADLVTCEPNIQLSRAFGVSSARRWWAPLLAFAVPCIALGLWWLTHRPAPRNRRWSPL